MYLVSPSEQAGCVDVWMGIVFIVRHLNVVPHTVVYPGHGASKNPSANKISLKYDSAKFGVGGVYTQLTRIVNQRKSREGAESAFSKHKILIFRRDELRRAYQASATQSLLQDSRKICYRKFPFDVLRKRRKSTYMRRRIWRGIVRQRRRHFGLGTNTL